VRHRVMRAALGEFLMCALSRNAMELRSKYAEAFLKKHGLKLGFMSFFVKAATAALVDQPVVNAGARGKRCGHV
jgi:pyruvate/2-oxoglutarate dehydrogenase complex dihydrolipoamide acyltransferase (E2) component